MIKFYILIFYEVKLIIPNLWKLRVAVVLQTLNRQLKKEMFKKKIIILRARYFLKDSFQYIEVKFAN